MKERRILILVTSLLALGAIPALFVAQDPPHASSRADLAALADMIDVEQDHLTPVEVDSLLASGFPLVIYDLRDSLAFALGHLPTATRVAVADLLRLTPDSMSHLLLYSEGGVHAGQAWVLLKAGGHPHVHTLLGSWNGWSAAHPQPISRRTAPAAKMQNNSRERERLNGEC